MDFTMPSVEDLTGSQQESYTSVTSVATVVDEKCEEEGNVLSTHTVAEDGAVEVIDLFLPEKRYMFERLNGKIGRVHQSGATDHHRPKEESHHAVRIFDYSCIPPLDDETELPLKATQIDYNVEPNTKSHHTDMFEMTKVRQDQDPLPKLVVRRGLPFFLNFHFNEKFSSDTNELLLTFQFGQAAAVSKGSQITVSVNKGIKPHNWSAGFSKIEDSTVTVQILTPNDCIVGKCFLIVDTKKRDPNEEDKRCQSNGDHFTATVKHTTFLRYHHNEPIYILFNPWLKDDQVYVKDDKVRDECIVSDFGKLLVGNYKQVVAVPWRFAQFERNVLDCCLYMLDAVHLEHTARGNATVVVRNIASLINSCEDSGVLLADWSGHYKDGTAPTAWLGSVLILEEFWKKKGPVGYGQCWVFAALATTVCRCLGIPTRCVTNYSSAHDCDGTNTINYHWNIRGEPLDSMNTESIWSFHVWNEAYLTRLDIPDSMAGWQAFDPTPQIASDGIYCAGPCPVDSIRQGDVHLRFDTALLFSELNVNRFHWILRDDGSWRTILQKNIAGKAVLTHPPLNDESAPEESRDYVDLTDQYKCAEGTKEEKAMLLRANTWATNAGVFDKGDGDVRVTLDQNTEVVAGTSFDVLVQLQNRSRFNRTAKVTLTLLSTYYTGHRKYKVKSQTFDVVVCPLKREQVSMRVLGEDYAYYMSDCATFKICTMVRVAETDQLFVDCTDFCVLCPKLDIEISEFIQVGRSFDCTIKLNSQMPIDLTHCEWMIECLGVTPATKIVEKDLEPYAQVQLNFSLNPCRPGKTIFMVSFKSKQLMGVYGTREIEVTD